MASLTHSVVTQARTVSSADVKNPRAPVEVPSPGNPENVPNKKRRSKYKHVEALHQESRPSCLSHENAETPSFLGFRNLMVLVIIVMNLRLVVENIKKYGLLITLKSNITNSDLRIGLVLYALTPCHLFVAYIIERIAMENAKGALGRRKKTDIGINSPETERERREFYNTWWWIAFAHTVNASLSLLVSSFVVYYGIHNPGVGIISELHAIVVWLKTCSYAFTNRDLRHAMLNPSDSSAMLPQIYLKCPYPRNITLSNLCYFWWAPTLVYQPCYPRTENIRWGFVAKRFGEVLALSVFMWVCSLQFAKPVLLNSLEKMAALDYLSIMERLMKLSTISLIVWLAGFFAIFQSFLNALAEIMQFGDRVFYDDWWNSTNLRQYWASWNKPVYHFMRRHIYTPLVGRGVPPRVAAACVFAFSGLLHELAVGVPAHNILGVAFLGMMFQLPLIHITEPLTKSLGLTGKAKHGELSQSRAQSSWSFGQYWQGLVGK